MFLTDKQRIELILPSHMMLGVVIASRKTDDPSFDELLGLLIQATAEPVMDLPKEKSLRLLNRAKRAHATACEPWTGKGQDPGSFGLIVFYWLRSLLAASYIVYEPGSLIDKALVMYMEFHSERADIGAARDSALKQSAKLQRRFHEIGYYNSQVDLI